MTNRGMQRLLLLVLLAGLIAALAGVQAVRAAGDPDSDPPWRRWARCRYRLTT